MTTQDLTTYFFKGETAEIGLLAKNPDGTVLSNPDNQKVIITFGLTANGDPLVSYDNRYMVTDIPTSKFVVTLTAADMVLLVEDKSYFYNLWTQHLTDDPRLQAHGKFKLQKSVQP